MTREFLLVAVQGESAEHISEPMGAVAKVALAHDAFVASLISSLVVIVYGVLPFCDKAKGDRSTLARSLERRFGNQNRSWRQGWAFRESWGKKLLAVRFFLTAILKARFD